MILTRNKEIALILIHKINNYELIKIIVKKLNKIEFNDSKKLYINRYYINPNITKLNNWNNYNDYKLTKNNKIINEKTNILNLYPKNINNAELLGINLNRYILNICIKMFKNGFIDYYENSIPRKKYFNMVEKINWINKKIKYIHNYSWLVKFKDNNMIPKFIINNLITWSDEKIVYYSLFDDLTNDLLLFDLIKN